MKKFRILLLLAAVMLEVGCGLPDSFFLQPPISVLPASPTSNTFKFANPVHDFNHDINVSFTGNELYYKLYSDPSQITGNDYSQSDPSDASAQLATKGFYPLCLASDPVGSRTDPVIAIDSGTAAAGSTIQVFINQPPGTGATSFYTLNATTLPFARNAVNTVNGTVYKTFQQNTQSDGTTAGNGYVAGDTDFSAIAGNTFGGVIYVAWYVISFGYTNTSTPSRSTAVYLGYMSIPYP